MQGFVIVLLTSQETYCDCAQNSDTKDTQGWDSCLFQTAIRLRNQQVNPYQKLCWYTHCYEKVSKQVHVHEVIVEPNKLSS